MSLPPITPETARQLERDMYAYGYAFIDQHGNRLEPLIAEHIPNGLRRRIRTYDECAHHFGFDSDTPLPPSDLASTLQPPRTKQT